MHLDLIRPGTDEFIGCALQIGRDGSAMLDIVAASERLPGEVVLVNREIAGETLDPLAQDRNRISGRNQLVILRRRNAQGIERNRTLGEEANRLVVEQRRNMAFEQPALFGWRTRREDRFEFLAVQSGDRVEHADEAPKQAITIEIAREHVDASSAQGNMLLPMAPGDFVQTRAQKIVIGGAIGAVVGLTEEAEELLMRRQIPERRQFQPGQRDVVGIEIHRNDLRRIGGEIVQHVAAARCDGQDAMVRLKFQSREIDIGIFPDLVIDKALKHKRKKPLQGAAACRGGPLMGSLFQKRICHRVPWDSPRYCIEIREWTLFMTERLRVAKKFNAFVMAEMPCTCMCVPLWERHDQQNEGAHRGSSRSARSGEDRGKYLSRPKPRRPHATRVRWPGAGPGPGGRQPDRGRAHLSFVPRLLPARRRSQNSNTL